MACFSVHLLGPPELEPRGCAKVWSDPSARKGLIELALAVGCLELPAAPEASSLERCSWLVPFSAAPAHTRSEGIELWARELSSSSGLEWPDSSPRQRPSPRLFYSQLANKVLWLLLNGMDI